MKHKFEVGDIVQINAKETGTVGPMTTAKLVVTRVYSKGPDPCFDAEGLYHPVTYYGWTDGEGYGQEWFTKDVFLTEARRAANE